MEKGYVLKQLEKNDQEHQKLLDKVDKIAEIVNQNHLELIRSINDNKLDINTLKIKMGTIALVAGSLPTLIGLILKI